MDLKQKQQLDRLRAMEWQVKTFKNQKSRSKERKRVMKFINECLWEY